MPQPCIASTASINLTANGSPAVLQADARLSAAPNRLLVASDGLLVRDTNARVFVANNQPGFPPSTPIYITWTGLRFSTSGFLTASALTAGQAAFVISTSGVWRFGLGFVIDATTTAGADFYVDLYVNATLIGTAIDRNSKVGAQPIATTMSDWLCAAGDVVQAQLIHTDTASRTLVASERTYLSMSYVGPGV